MENFISVFDILKIGVGPSSSHTYGPWKAASDWVNSLSVSGRLGRLTSVTVDLYGSLALTGKGHYTDRAVILGLSQENPETIKTERIAEILENIEKTGKLFFNGTVAISFEAEKNIRFNNMERLPYHSNGMKFCAWSEHDLLDESVYYSTGGGFIVKEGGDSGKPLTDNILPYTYKNSRELSEICSSKRISVSHVVMENEKVFRSETEICDRLLTIWEVMKQTAFEGCHTSGVLPGRLQVKRRAADLNKSLLRVHNYENADEWIEAMKVGRDFRKVLTRVSCLAIAVNEVNAAMGRVVTAPTNGSAGVIPAVLFYYICFSGQEITDRSIVNFLLTAAEIGRFFKTGATISAAAGGCQAEIGVSSSMAAAALAEALGGTPAQTLMAAEIAAEHHLGLTCDPVDGLVQIPCIERNSMGAVKAITAAMIALAGEPGNAKVSLDAVIKSMKETADEMSTKFKETSLGGLAVQVGVNVPEC
jgi:L-serine dehydratase